MSTRSHEYAPRPSPRFRSSEEPHDNSRCIRIKLSQNTAQEPASNDASGKPANINNAQPKRNFTSEREGFCRTAKAP